jgi:AraC-like DNA-binding protein
MNPLAQDFLLQDTASITGGLGLPLVPRVALVRSHSASRIGWHSHQFYEVLCLGEGATVYEFSGGETVELFGGNFLVIPPETVHRGLDDFRQPALLCGMMLDIENDSSIRYTPFASSDLRWLKTQLRGLALRPTAMTRELRSLIGQLPSKIETFDEKDSPNVLLMRAQLCQILVLLANQRQQAEGGAPTEHNYVDKAIQYMNQHLSGPTSIRMVAHHAGCSRARLFDVFKESTGMTPNDYWQRIRIEEAFRRVSDSSQSFTQIAMDCGFSTSQYFCTVFRKYWGMSPTQCRRKYALNSSETKDDSDGQRD